VAERADELREWFLVAEVEASLPRRLASKGGLAELCAQYGIPAPRSARPRTREELLERATAIGFPVVLKNDAAFERLAHPAVHGTTVVRDDVALERLASGCRRCRASSSRSCSLRPRRGLDRPRLLRARAVARVTG